MNRRILLPIIILMTASAMALGASTISKDQLVLLPVKNEPSVAFRIWFAAGAQDEPAGKEGLASITASMLTDASTTVNSYEQILDKLFPLAASYSATSSQEMTVIGGRVHKDNLKDYYPLLMDAILRPAFKQEDLDRIKSQVLNYLENTLRYSSDEELGKAVLYTSLFKGTPYGHITGGTIDAVKSITLDDVRAFYAKHYTRENVIIGVGGGYTADLLDRLGADLAALPAGRPAPVAKPVAQKLDGFRVSMVDKDAPATAISMGFPINVSRGSRDWYALAVANSWLGEHRNSSSHLYQVIREERGLNYGDYSYIEHFPGAGFRRMPPQNVARRQQIFEMWIRPVPNETRHFALRAALREFKRLVVNGLTDEEFQLTRKFLSKYVLHYAETTEERLGYAIDDRFYNVAGSHLELFRKNLATLTRDEVNAAIKKYLQYGSMQIAIVTKDASSFKNELVNDTPSPITYKSPKSASVLDEDKEIIVFPVKVKPENITIIPVTEAFQK
jgi:zinc protease